MSETAGYARPTSPAWKPGPDAAKEAVGGGDGEGVADCRTATVLGSGAQAARRTKKAAIAAAHLPHTTSLRANCDASVSRSANFQSVEANQARSRRAACRRILWPL